MKKIIGYTAKFDMPGRYNKGHFYSIEQYALNGELYPEVFDPVYEIDTTQPETFTIKDIEYAFDTGCKTGREIEKRMRSIFKL